MAANIFPISVVTISTAIGGAAITGANTATDGTGTVTSLFTAGSNGSFVRGIMVKGAGTNAASVMRVFINNGSSTGTAANNSLRYELALAATTASNSAPIGPDFYLPMDLNLPASYVITICFGTAGSAGWIATVEAGNY
jgi:hypothetical protein